MLTIILQLNDPTIPLSFLEGELFKVDVTCDDIDGKLIFKYNGTSILTNKGRTIAN